MDINICHVYSRLVFGALWLGTTHSKCKDKPWFIRHFKTKNCRWNVNCYTLLQRRKKHSIVSQVFIFFFFCFVFCHNSIVFNFVKVFLSFFFFCFCVAQTKLGCEKNMDERKTKYKKKKQNFYCDFSNGSVKKNILTQ